VMEAAGLTHGGFYKHFADKDQLLQEAVANAIAKVATQIEALTQDLPRAEALSKVISFYLSEEHLRNPELGCALAALGTELGRMPQAMKKEVSKALDAHADRLDFLLPGSSPQQRRAGFLVLFPAMAGCMIAARAYGSRQRQQQILSAGRMFFQQAFCGDSNPSFQRS